MSPRLTVFCHFWNEEFLLPYWLRHHTRLFDHGVLIDYGSTDRSVQICKELAPSWEVRASRNAEFDARACDQEVMDLETEHQGWKFALNTTEFLFHADLRGHLATFERQDAGVPAIGVQSVVMVDGPSDRGSAVTEEDLFLQRWHGYFDDGFRVRRPRYCHRERHGAYELGRHQTRHPSVIDPEPLILWWGWSPYEQVRARKLQIQTRIPESDRRQGHSWQHFVTPEKLDTWFLAESRKARNLLDDERYSRSLAAVCRSFGLPAPGGLGTRMEDAGRGAHRDPLEAGVLLGLDGAKGTATSVVTNQDPHVERYRWAVEQLRGADVLDTAAGTGLGAAMLARAKSSPRVLGVDRSPAAVALSIAHHASERVSFEVIEDLENAAFPGKRFDTIVSLDTLEHTPHPVSVLRHLHGLLSDGGRLILSAPSGARPADDSTQAHCFTFETLRAIVSEGFDIEAELDQDGKHLTVAARKRGMPCAAWTPSAAPRPRATVVLVTWNSVSNVVDLVSAIRAFATTQPDILVVDNFSSDGTRSFLRLFAGEPGFRLVENPENRRCTAATNQAIVLSKTEYVIYLCASHALVADRGWDEELIRFLDERPEIGLAGHVWNPRFTLESARYRPGWTPSGHGLEALAHVQGGVWIARRTTFDELGLFDAEAFPHSGMDVEFSYRALSHGKTLGSHPGVQCPPFPEIARRRGGVFAYHPATPELRADVRTALGRRPDASSTQATTSRAGLPGWRCSRGEVQAVGSAGFLVRGSEPDSGLVSDAIYRDVRISGRIAYRGRAIVKARIGPSPKSAQDGYHVLVGAGPNYLARACHELGRFDAPPSAFRFVFELRGRRLTLDIDGRRVLSVEDGLLAEGRLLLGVNEGEAVFSDVSIEPLDAAVSSGPGLKPKALVYCERLDNESFCESIIRELGAFYEVQPFGPGWPIADLAQIDAASARFYLELDAATGRFCRPEGLDRLSVPKFAWLIDTHKKIGFHQTIAREMDLTFFAMKNWGHVLPGPIAWLPVHADTAVWTPEAREREWDIVFVGSHNWRAEPILRIAQRHGLKVHVASTTGPREKTETAAIYARSKLVFNRHVTNDMNFRVVEAMACGRVLLTDAQWNGQYELFQDGKHYVLYKDEGDLEQQILRYLGDDAARARIESEAGALALRAHSTKARVRELRDAIEGHFARANVRAETVVAASPEPRRSQPLGAEPGPHVPAPLRVSPTPGSHPTALPSRSKRVVGENVLRWLFFVGDEPGTVERKTYAELLACGLAARGHRVTVARKKRCALPPRRPGPDEPRILELDCGPIPNARGASRLLVDVASLHARFDRAFRDLGPFDVIVGEGPQGGLVAQPLAEREGRPFVLALQGCEVSRRKNRLSRAQLYGAELEHWASDRALAVALGSAGDLDATRRFYKTARVHHVAPPAPTCPQPKDASRLLSALGVAAGTPLVLVLAEELGQRDARLLLERASPSESVLVLASGDDVWLRTSSGAASLASRQSARGSVLAALMLAARAVVALTDDDRRAAEARVLGRPVAFAGDGQDQLDVLALADSARVEHLPERCEDGILVLEEIAAKKPIRSHDRAAQKGAPVRALH